MKSRKFSEKVFKEEIKNGTIFNVYKNEEKIGQVGVIKSSVMYLDFKDKNIPTDILTGNYELIEEGE